MTFMLITSLPPRLSAPLAPDLRAGPRRHRLRDRQLHHQRHRTRQAVARHPCAGPAGGARCSRPPWSGSSPCSGRCSRPSRWRLRAPILGLIFSLPLAILAAPSLSPHPAIVWVVRGIVALLPHRAGPRLGHRLRDRGGPRPRGRRSGADGGHHRLCRALLRRGDGGDGQGPARGPDRHGRHAAAASSSPPSSRRRCPR